MSRIMIIWAMERGLARWLTLLGQPPAVARDCPQRGGDVTCHGDRRREP